MLSTLLPAVHNLWPVRISKEKAMIEVTFDKLATDPDTRRQMVWLRSIPGDLMFPLFIRSAEAISIYMSLRDKQTPLPLEYDLTETVLDRLNARVESAHIGHMNDGTVYAELELIFEEGNMSLEISPGDGIALALRHQAPIFLLETVKEPDARLSARAGIEEEYDEAPDLLVEFDRSEEEDELVELDETDACGEPEIWPDWSEEDVATAIEDVLLESGVEDPQLTGPVSPAARVTMLKRQMALAVRWEDYEEAGRIRCKIDRVREVKRS